MLEFWIPALVLLALFVLFLLLPVMRKDLAVDDDRKAVNLALYHQRLAEIEQDVNDEAERAVLVEELQRELLVNAEGDVAGDTAIPTATPTTTPTTQSSTRLPYILAGVMPILALLLFTDAGFSLGAVSDVVVSEKLSNISLADESGLAEAAEVLAQSLANEPDNDQGWFLLGQTYMGLKKYAQAQDAFGRLKDRFPSEPSIVSYYAEAAFLANDREMTPEISIAIDDALALNPNDISMLEVKGMDAFVKGELATARDYFSRVLPLVQGERNQIIRQVIARIDLTLGKPAEQEVAQGRIIHVQVALGDRVPTDYNWSVFVFARAASGPPMPLAVQRATMDELPKTFVLTENMAMIPGMGLANFDDVVVVARTSAQGVANSGPDDWEARSEVLHLPDHSGVVTLTINEQIKDIRIPASADSEGAKAGD